MAIDNFGTSELNPEKHKIENIKDIYNLEGKIAPAVFNMIRNRILNNLPGSEEDHVTYVNLVRNKIIPLVIDDLRAAGQDAEADKLLEYLKYDYNLAKLVRNSLFNSLIVPLTEDLKKHTVYQEGPISEGDTIIAYTAQDGSTLQVDYVGKTGGEIINTASETSEHVEQRQQFLSALTEIKDQFAWLNEEAIDEIGQYLCTNARNELVINEYHPGDNVRTFLASMIEIAEALRNKYKASNRVLQIRDKGKRRELVEVIGFNINGKTVKFVRDTSGADVDMVNSIMNISMEQAIAAAKRSSAVDTDQQAITYKLLDSLLKDATYDEPEGVFGRKRSELFSERNELSSVGGINSDPYRVIFAGFELGVQTFSSIVIMSKLYSHIKQIISSGQLDNFISSVYGGIKFLTPLLQLSTGEVVRFEEYITKEDITDYLLAVADGNMDFFRSHPKYQTKVKYNYKPEAQNLAEFTLEQIIESGIQFTAKRSLLNLPEDLDLRLRFMKRSMQIPLSLAHLHLRIFGLTTSSMGVMSSNLNFTDLILDDEMDGSKLTGFTLQRIADVIEGDSEQQKSIATGCPAIPGGSIEVIKDGFVAVSETLGNLPLVDTTESKTAT
jgi:hypothetical protein